jgi:hypothetical protein
VNRGRIARAGRLAVPVFQGEDQHQADRQDNRRCTQTKNYSAPQNFLPVRPFPTTTAMLFLIESHLISSFPI